MWLFENWLAMGCELLNEVCVVSKRECRLWEPALILLKALALMSFVLNGGWGMAWRPYLPCQWAE